MHIELLAGSCDVNSRSFTGKDGQRREVHEQPAYLWMPGAPYPLPFSLPLQTPAQAYAPGTYVFSSDSVRTNNFGNLEFNRFGMSLVRANIQGESKDKPRAVNG